MQSQLGWHVHKYVLLGLSHVVLYISLYHGLLPAHTSHALVAQICSPSRVARAPLPFLIIFKPQFEVPTSCPVKYGLKSRSSANFTLLESLSLVNGLPDKDKPCSSRCRCPSATLALLARSNLVKEKGHVHLIDFGIQSARVRLG